MTKLDQIATALGATSGSLGTPNTPASNPPSSNLPPVPSGSSAPSSTPKPAGGTTAPPAPAFAGGGGASAAVGAGWSATAGGSILTPPSYSQARAQSGDMTGTQAARQLLSQSSVSKPIMT